MRPTNDVFLRVSSRVPGRESATAFYAPFHLIRTHSQFLESLTETCRSQISALADDASHPSMLHVWFRI